MPDSTLNAQRYDALQKALADYYAKQETQHQLANQRRMQMEKELVALELYLQQASSTDSTLSEEQVQQHLRESYHRLKRAYGRRLFRENLIPAEVEQFFLLEKDKRDRPWLYTAISATAVAVLILLALVAPHIVAGILLALGITSLAAAAVTKSKLQELSNRLLLIGLAVSIFAVIFLALTLAGITLFLPFTAPVLALIALLIAIVAVIVEHQIQQEIKAAESLQRIEDTQEMAQQHATKMQQQLVEQQQQAHVKQEAEVQAKHQQQQAVQVQHSVENTGVPKYEFVPEPIVSPALQPTASPGIHSLFSAAARANVERIDMTEVLKEQGLPEEHKEESIISERNSPEKDIPEANPNNSDELDDIPPPPGSNL